ncbi:MAG: hypothetical protein ACREUU_01300 [Gammaproteobacteria bacterium]
MRTVALVYAAVALLAQSGRGAITGVVVTVTSQHVAPPLAPVTAHVLEDHPTVGVELLLVIP